MSDSYQAVYDAVRSRISGCNVGDVVGEAARAGFDPQYIASQVSNAVDAVRDEMTRPSVLYRPRLWRVEKDWFAMYGDNDDNDGDGVIGMGASPAEAMANFDGNWFRTFEDESTGGQS